MYTERDTISKNWQYLLSEFYHRALEKHPPGVKCFRLNCRHSVFLRNDEYINKGNDFWLAPVNSCNCETFSASSCDVLSDFLKDKVISEGSFQHTLLFYFELISHSDRDLQVRQVNVCGLTCIFAFGSSFCFINHSRFIHFNHSTLHHSEYVRQAGFVRSNQVRRFKAQENQYRGEKYSTNKRK